MKNSILILMALALIGLAFAPIGTTNAEQAAYLEGAWRCEPVLLFDQTGEGWWGPIHTQLAVYNDGMVKFSQDAERDTMPVIWTRHVPRHNVREFWETLKAAGAFGLEDHGAFADDLPMNTVTIFHGRTNAVAHTFSFFVPEGRYARILRIIETFIVDPIG